MEPNFADSGTSGMTAAESCGASFRQARGFISSKHPPKGSKHPPSSKHRSKHPSGAAPGRPGRRMMAAHRGMRADIHPPKTPRTPYFSSYTPGSPRAPPAAAAAARGTWFCTEGGGFLRFSSLGRLFSSRADGQGWGCRVARLRHDQTSHVLTVCSLRPYGGADICDPQVRIAGSCPPASTTSPTSLLRAGAARRALPHRHRHRHLRRRHCHHHHHIAALSPCFPCHRR